MLSQVIGKGRQLGYGAPLPLWRAYGRAVRERGAGVN